MFCIYCGNTHNDDAKFCPVCGREVYRAAQTPAPTETAVQTPALPETAVLPETPVQAEQPHGLSKGGRLALILSCCLVGAILLSVLGLFIAGQALYSAGNYDSARKCYSMIGADRLADSCDYERAREFAEAGDYEQAWIIFDSLPGYKDSDRLAAEARRERALEKCAEGEFGDALELCEDAQELVDCDSIIKECEIALAIEMYENGDYEDAFDLLLTYTGDDTADAYSNLCVYRTVDEMGSAGLESVKTMYGMLEPYMHIDAVAEALSEPFFFIARLFDAEYEYRHYSFECDSEELMITHYLPFRTPGGDILTRYDDTGYYFYKGEELWFCVTGFSTYDTLHPEEMYVLGADSKEYIFTIVD